MREITVTEHLLNHQKRWSPAATGQFTQLLNDLILSAKIISRSVNKAGLLDILGGTGDINVQGESVQKLDDYADQILHLRMERSGVVCALASEERESVYFVPQEKNRGRYFLIFDPLDGSSNIDVNINVGTIFGIYRLSEEQAVNTKLEDLLQAGAEQVAAGYFLYGTSTMLVYTTGHGVHGFTLDPSVGEFLLSHENITIPEKGKYYSVNESNYPQWDDNAKKAVSWFKTPRGEKNENYSLRYVGSLVADFHRTLIYGGIFLYPQDKRKPEGKLRLMYEAAPLAFLIEQAGGKATNGTERILDIIPKSVHTRTPLFIGSPKDVEIVEAAYSNSLVL